MLFLGNTQFDFARDMANVSQQGGNYPGIHGGGVTPPDDAGAFIRFSGTNYLYNIYDAGNFITGKALQMLNFSQSEVLKGADLNSRISGDGPDTSADQNALKNGYNYNRVGWKK